MSQPLHENIDVPKLQPQSCLHNQILRYWQFAVLGILIEWRERYSTGKSTLVSALLKKPPVDTGKDEPGIDLAIGYIRADSRDEGEEDILARLSVYTVPSSAPSYAALVPHFLQPKSALPHTDVVIGLDWIRQRSFLEELHTWLAWIERCVQGDGARELDVIREEHRESLYSLLATYSALQGTILPLGPGTFTRNTASERSDGVLPIPRTICFEILFYATPLQTTLNSYLYPPSPDGALDSTAAPVRNPFHSVYKPNTLDHDRIVVPAGWDGETWERDLSSDTGIVSDSDDGERKMYASLVQDQGSKPTPLPPLNNPTPEQAYLAKNYDENPRHAGRNPLVAFSLPTVERAPADMEGSSCAKLGGLGRRAGAPTSPILGSVASPTGHEVLQNFLNNLLNPKDRTASPATSAVSPGTGAAMAAASGCVRPASSGSAGAVRPKDCPRYGRALPHGG
ncbi:hypothetical protein V8E53_001635 [Lactarius tabidus]